MKTSTTIKHLVTLITLFLFSFNACQSEPLAVEEISQTKIVIEDAPLSPCDMKENLYGEEVRVFGEVICFGRDDEGNILFELVDGSCKVYIFIDKTTWEGWAQEARGRIAAASQLTVIGMLKAYGYESEIEVFEPPV